MNASTRICVTGDVHGHIQLTLGVAAHWQRELDSNFEAVLFCGDVGTFTRRDEIDRRRPDCWWEFHPGKWAHTRHGKPVAPPLAHLIPD